LAHYRYEPQSQPVRRMGLRRARYDGLQKVHVQHVFTAVAINVLRAKTYESGVMRVCYRPRVLAT